MVLPDPFGPRHPRVAPLGPSPATPNDLVFPAQNGGPRLARRFCRRHRHNAARLFVLTLDAAFEDKVAAGIEHSERGLFIRTAPQTIEKLCESIGNDSNC